MTANKSKSYLAYLNKLVDEYNNSYHYSFDKEPIIVIFFVLSEEIESSHQALKFKASDRSGQLSLITFLTKLIGTNGKKKSLRLIPC